VVGYAGGASPSPTVSNLSLNSPITPNLSKNIQIDTAFELFFYNNYKRLKKYSIVIDKGAFLWYSKGWNNMKIKILYNKSKKGTFNTECCGIAAGLLNENKSSKTLRKERSSPRGV
jgi:hypothetical protein